MVKPLPFPNTSSPIFTRAGQRPLPPPAGARAQAWGGAIQQTGKAVEDYGGYLDKQTQAQGKAQMDTDYRNAMLQEMVKKRELALRVLKSKEEMDNANWAFKVLADKRDQEARGEQKEAHGFRKEIAVEQQRVDKEIKDFEAEFNKRMNDAAAGKGKFSKDDAISLATIRGVAKDPRVRGVIQQKFPPPRAIPAYRGRAELTAKEAEMAIPYLEQQLRGILDQTEIVTGQSFDRTQVVSDFMRGDYKIFSVPAEGEKRSALQKLEERARKKMEEIDKNKVKARIPFEQGGADYLSIEEQLNRMEEENQRLSDQYQQLLQP